MRLKIKVKNFKGKKVQIEKEIPAKDHLEAQKRYKSQTFKPKKGKGSFSRKQKYKNDYE